MEAQLENLFFSNTLKNKTSNIKERLGHRGQKVGTAKFPTDLTIV